MNLYDKATDRLRIFLPTLSICKIKTNKNYGFLSYIVYKIITKIHRRRPLKVIDSTYFKQVVRTLINNMVLFEIFDDVVNFLT